MATKGLKLRYLMLLTVGLLALIALGSSVWNMHEARRHLATTQLAERANHLAEVMMRASVLAAMERGATATILGSPRAPARSLVAEMHALRKEDDVIYEQVMDRTQALMNIEPSDMVRQSLGALARQRYQFHVARRNVDRVLGGEAESIDTDEWVAAATRYVRSLAALQRAAMSSISRDARTQAYNHLIKEVMFTLLEYAGLERAMVGTAVSAGRPLSKGELLTLTNYRTIVDKSSEKLERILQRIPSNAGINAARDHARNEFWGGYQDLRESVYAAAESGAAYPVPADTWYREATRGIDSLIGLGHALNNFISDELAVAEREWKHALTIIGAAIGAIVLLAFIAVRAMYVRGFKRLQQLESAANAIAAGDLSQPVALQGADELGDLGRAFEQMRLSLLADVLERDGISQEMRKLDQVIEHSVSCIAVTDAQGRVEYVNPEFTRITGYEAEEIVGAKMSLVSSGRTPVERYRELWDTITAGKVWQGEIQNRKKNGELYWVLASISPVKNTAGETTHYVTVQHDITDRKQMEERINYLAYYDELTQLPNRALLNDRFARAAARARRLSRQVAILTLDLDRFKLINDSMGHSVGDELLRRVARRLGGAVRDDDTVARYGGDEFVLLLPDVAESTDIVDTIRRIFDTVSEPIHLEERELRISCSIGVSVHPRDGKRLDELLDRADAAMYRAKELGCNRFLFYTQELNDRARERLTLDVSLRQAIDEGQFELYYQPQVELSTGRVLAVESLVRWIHPDLGLTPPSEFIPLAEETGLIVALGEWVLRRSCQQLRDWHRAGLAVPAVAVNVSARQLEQDEFPELIADVLDHYGLRPGSLELELTEKALMSRPEMMDKQLRRLRKAGVRLALDDFGTGYSSLAYLRRCPFDKLKIDRSFVRNVIEDPDESAVALTIIAMAQTLHLQTIAEGTETQAQCRYLDRHGCGAGQGFYFARPLPAGEIEPLLGGELPFAGRTGVEPGLAQPAVLLVAEDPETLTSLRETLATPHRDVPLLQAASMEQAFDMLAAHEVTAVVACEPLSGAGAPGFLGRVKDLYPQCRRVMVSSFSPMETVIGCFNDGIIHTFLTKPWHEAELAAVVREAVRHSGSGAPQTDEAEDYRAGASPLD
ncbi:MAG: EAL domain-containing protein [Gammaproteobacteria bacterium]|nr:EAL domain-containing protein [Gammaproteobacteria bacterium]NIR98032.1 EAL domain-containing protein [Gammaproteobacteria bacterium]NIT63739.1 EAL domain-containing protein [Gammaproteobacteria bacterium]NIV19914.1 EAL domain-containing protein [Gammaproteobacteria bacterium]NIX11403.1 EAL domain-containing protein [Gammaproteobacteria bacterium]